MHVVNKHFRCWDKHLFASTHVITDTIATEMASCAAFGAWKSNRSFTWNYFALGLFHSEASLHLKLLTSLAAPDGELTSAVETPVRPVGFRLVFSSFGKHNGQQCKAGMTEQRANESLLSARLSGDQILPQLGPSFNANGHLHEVKEWFWLPQSHDFHTHAHYRLTHEWYNDKWGIDALKPFHHALSSPLLYHLFMLHFICIKIFSSRGLTRCMSFTGSIDSCVHTSVYPMTEQNSSCLEWFCRDKIILLSKCTCQILHCMSSLLE